MNTTILNDANSDALRAKIITMVSLFVISMVVGCIPLLISLKFDWFTKSVGTDVRSSNRLVLGLLAFGGGVLFATAFMHLLPELDENVHLLQEEGDLPEMPIYLAPLIMCLGFFMMYLIEELVHLYIRRREREADAHLTRILSIRNSEDVALSLDRPDRSVDKGTMSSNEVEMANGHGHSHAVLDPTEDRVAAGLRGLLIVLALSIHELFEGLAVGLEASSANVWYMFGAVSAHKYIIAFCMGVELLAAATGRWLSVAYIFTFSFMSALGIGVGILLVGGAGATEAGLASVVLQGLACGTIVYVVFFEIWRTDRPGLMLLLCSFLGFAVMVVLEALVELFVLSNGGSTDV